MVLDAAYNAQMEEQGYPDAFCDDVLTELAGFAVWPGGVCPDAHPPKAKPAARPPQGAGGGAKAGKAAARPPQGVGGAAKGGAAKGGKKGGKFGGRGKGGKDGKGAGGGKAGGKQK